MRNNRNANENYKFSNRMSKCQARKRLEKALPQTPRKRSDLLRTYIGTSLTSKTTEACLSGQVVQNMNDFIESTKKEEVMMLDSKLL